MASSSKISVTIDVTAKDQMEALRKGNAAKKLLDHLDVDVLEILATKCTKIGINAKVRLMQNMI